MTGPVALGERIRSSWSFEPMIFLILGVVLAQVSVMIDTEINQAAVDIPFVLTSTVESTRAVLSTIAAATITVAGIAFSVSLLIIQLASSQYSPRVVHGLFRDPFNKRVMGVVVGTFTYCLVVLRSVRDSVEDGGTPVIPNISAALAVLFGLIAVMAIVAFIDHSAHTMDVSQILQRITDDTLQQVRRVWPDRGGATPGPVNAVPDSGGFSVVNEHNGWIQHVDHAKLLKVAEPGGTIELHAAVGHYAVRGAPLCTIWPAPEGDDGRDATTAAVRESITIGRTRTMSQDVSYGLRQLTDVGIKALSPGINDPTTAQDAIFHITAVLAEVLRRDAPQRSVEDDEGRRLIDEGENRHVEMIALSYDELRHFATDQPRVSIYLLESISMLIDLLKREGIADWTETLRQQAQLIVEGTERSGLLAHDIAHVRAAHARRFG